MFPRMRALDPGLYWVQLLGYSVVSLTNVLELTACSLLSSVWFPSGERGIATAVIAAVAPAVRTENMVAQNTYIHMCFECSA